MLAMLPGGWSLSSVRFCKRGSCLSPSAGLRHHDDVIAWSLGEVSYLDGSMGWFGRPETRRKKMRISGGLTTLHFQAA
jgi:hypothetical protein